MPPASRGYRERTAGLGPSLPGESRICMTSVVGHVEALNRVRQVMEQMSGEGTVVRDISRTLIPGEEVVFSVYAGPSADAVRQLNERADIPVSRIVEAIAVTQD
jgi:hypothetical protein